MVKTIRERVNGHDVTFRDSLFSADSTDSTHRTFNPVQLMKMRSNNISVDLRSDTVTRPTDEMREAMSQVWSAGAFLETSYAGVGTIRLFTMSMQHVCEKLKHRIIKDSLQNPHMSHKKEISFCM